MKTTIIGIILKKFNNKKYHKIKVKLENAA